MNPSCARPSFPPPSPTRIQMRSSTTTRNTVYPAKNFKSTDSIGTSIGTYKVDHNKAMKDYGSA